MIRRILSIGGMRRDYIWKKQKRKKTTETKGQICLPGIRRKRVGKPVDPKKQPLAGDQKIIYKKDASKNRRNDAKFAENQNLGFS